MNKLVSLSCMLLSILIFSPDQLLGQGAIYSIMAGPSLSTQQVNGFRKDPFIRYNIVAQLESTSDISPNAALISLGYHVKGSAVNSYGYYNPNTGNEGRTSSSSMEFHNLSFSAGVKQRKEVGETFLSYGLGLRLDYNLKAEYDNIFKGLEGTQNQFTYGLNIDIGWEFPLSELVSTTIEIGFSPDLSAQIFIPRQATGYQNSQGNEIIIPESFIKNIVFEARAGFRFWRKIEYID